MNFRKSIFSLVYTVLFLVIPVTYVSAAPITVTFNAGAISNISSDMSIFDFTQFQLGENLIFTITMDTAVADINGAVGAGRFQDVAGTMVATGSITGTTIVLSNGVEVEVNNLREMDFESSLSEPSLLNPLILDNDIDYTAPFDIFTDPDNLALSLNEFLRSSFANQASSSTGEIEFFSGGPNGFVGLEFGPAIATPVPATIWLFSCSLGLLGGRRFSLVL
jgi:hypothetical protein